jgi:hypothetical protein
MVPELYLFEGSQYMGDWDKEPTLVKEYYVSYWKDEEREDL